VQEHAHLLHTLWCLTGHADFPLCCSFNVMDVVVVGSNSWWGKGRDLIFDLSYHYCMSCLTQERTMIESSVAKQGSLSGFRLPRGCSVRKKRGTGNELLGVWDRTRRRLR